MKSIWKVIMFVFGLFDKIVTLPLRYDPNSERFVAVTKFRKLIGWYAGCSVAFGFVFKIVYRLLCQVASPDRNAPLHFDLEAVFQYILGFLIVMECVACIFTCHYKVHSLVTLMNKILDVSKKQSRYYPGDRITILGHNLDTGATIATFASISILAFPIFTSSLPLVRRADPASHMSIILFPNNSVLTQRIFASCIQGGATIFGAMPTLQILLLATAIIIEFGGMMGDASKISNPWLAFQLLKANTVHTHAQKWKTSVADRRVGLSNKPTQLKAEQDPNVVSIKVLAANKIVNSRNRRRIISKWKEIYYKITCFHPNLLLHRQMTILSTIMDDALVIYSPTLLLTGTSVIIVTVFFPLRFNLPYVVAAPCVVIAVTVTAVMFILVPTGSLVVRSSNQFARFWRLRLRTPVNRMQLKSCCQVAIWIGPFGYFHERTLLIVLNVILTYLSTLLINVKVPEKYQ